MKKKLALLGTGIYILTVLFNHKEHEGHEDYIPKINLHVLHGFNWDVF